jgi:tRNA threonylcarbamoyladenosine biosynthesis protein TsaE
MGGGLSYSLDNIRSVAETLLTAAGDLKIWTFSGDLGAGKTTLIAAICEALEVDDQVSSPTYAIIQEYHSPQGPVYHIDAYRIKNLNEALEIGMDELLESGAYCFVEWADKIMPILPEHYFSLHISGDGDVRKLTYSII